MGIKLTDLTKRFGDHTAVDGVSCNIETQEFFAIVGASGCGKSTLLRLIAGLDPVTSGEITLMGCPVSGPGLHMPSEARNVGFVFQSYALWPHMDVAGNVAFPAEMSGMSGAAAAEHATAQLAKVDLTDYADRKPADLSGGQRQRVALARCLAQGAQTILMDEPLANLDPHLRHAMEEELVDFHRKSGSTTVYITHDQREAMAVADRMAVMAAGRFLQVGTPQEIYERPATAEVARFIGSGALQPVTLRDGQAMLAGAPVQMTANPDAHGDALALIRPEQITLTQPGAGYLEGQVQSALYRGGRWEGLVTVEGLPEPFAVASLMRLVAGEAVGLKITGGWCLPDGS